jgi:hypothetical protein
VLAKLGARAHRASVATCILREADTLGRMAVLVILEMDGDTDALLAAAADLEERRPNPAVLARMTAPMEGGVVVCTLWESAEARDAFQADPAHNEALQASGLHDAVTGMRSRVFDDAELSLR